MSLKDSRLDLTYEDDYLLQGKFIYLDEIHKVYCEKRGKGPPILMIPGITGDASEFAALAALLSSDFTVISPDRRGYSRSPRGWSKSSVDEQANDLARLIDVLSIKTTGIITAGMGAAAALKLQMRFPKRIRGLILHEPWIPALLPEPISFRSELENAEKAIIAERFFRNTGPYEARMRYLMGECFESIPANSRKRLFKNGEMHSIENFYLDQWLPPAAGLFPNSLSSSLITVGNRSSSFLRNMTNRLSQELSILQKEVDGMHGAYIGKPKEYYAAVNSLVQSWRSS